MILLKEILALAVKFIIRWMATVLFAVCISGLFNKGIVISTAVITALFFPIIMLVEEIKEKR